MGILQSIAALALRPVVEGVCEKVGVAPVGVEAVMGLLHRQFSDPSQRLTKALQSAADQAWRVLELALAGDSLWDRCKGLLATGEQKAFRQQVQEFLEANPLKGLPTQDATVRAQCLRELQAARKAGLLTGGKVEATELAQQASHFSRYAGDAQALIAAEWKTLEQVAGELQRNDWHALAQLVSVRLPQGQPLLIIASRYFFRRQVETDAELSRGLTFSQLEGLSEVQQAGFQGMSEALTRHGRRMDEFLTGLYSVVADTRETVREVRTEQLRQGEIAADTHDSVKAVRTAVEQQAGVVTQTHDSVLNLQTEMSEKFQGLEQQLGRQLQPLYLAVQRMLEQRQLQDRPVRPADSLAVQTDQERSVVKELLRRYREIPEEQRRSAPALLNGLGKLQIAVGEFDGAQTDFVAAAALAGDDPAKAEAHYNAYRAALERAKPDEALRQLLQAVHLDRKHMPFPVDKYLPERILGAGGFGVTFLCRYRATHALVAVKALTQEGLGRDVAEVFQEAGTLDRLNHPAIVRLRECDFADPERRRGAYLVMEYFEGQTLEEYVRTHGPLPLGDFLEVARPVAEALHAAHRLGVLHRDVKPANVLVRKDYSGWQVKLIDFGLALEQGLLDTKSTVEGRRTLTGTSIAGTVDYAAPEQMGKEKAQAGPYSDIYGFAKTCCYALFRTPQPTWQDWRKLPESLAELLGVCLHQSPRDRPPDFSVVLPHLSGKVQAAPPAVPVAPLPPPVPSMPPPPPGPIAATPPLQARVTWYSGGVVRTLHLLPRAVVEAGRQTTKALCLRVEPVTDPVNRERTLSISSHHLTLRYLGDGVELLDAGSSNGTFLRGAQMSPGQACWVEPGMTISVAEVLDLELHPVPRRDVPTDSDSVGRQARGCAQDARWLQDHLIGAAKPGRVAFLRIVRKNNLTEEEYALLFHAGVIGSSADALIRLPTPGEPARLLVRDGWLCLERTGAEPVTVAGQALEVSRPLALTTACDWTVGRTTFRLEF